MLLVAEAKAETLQTDSLQIYGSSGTENYNLSTSGGGAHDSSGRVGAELDEQFRPEAPVWFVVKRTALQCWGEGL